MARGVRFYLILECTRFLDKPDRIYPLLVRPNVIVPLCGSFIFPTLISPTKDQGSATAAPMAKTT